MHLNNASTLSRIKERIRKLELEADELKQLNEDVEYAHLFARMVLNDTELN